MRLRDASSEEQFEKTPLGKKPGRKNAASDNVGRRKNFDDTSEDE